MNLDKNKLFPNQLTDFDGSECVALTATDIAGNLLGTPFNSDFTYAATLYLQNVAPNTNGSDPRAGMYSAVAYGLLPQTDTTFTSRTVGELYAANFANYTPTEKAQAQKYFMNAAKPVALDWQSIVTKLQLGIPVSLPMRWYWGSNPATVLTQPLTGQPFTNHNVAIYDYADPRGLTIKMWLGPNAGENGYCFLPRPVFEASAFASYCFDQNASRLLQLISLSIVYFPNLKLQWSNLFPS